MLAGAAALGEARGSDDAADPFAAESTAARVAAAGMFLKVGHDRRIPRALAIDDHA